MSCIFRSSLCQQAVCRLCRFPAAFIQTSAALQILELLLLKPSPPRYSAASAGTFSVHNRKPLFRQAFSYPLFKTKKREYRFYPALSLIFSKDQKSFL